MTVESSDTGCQQYADWWEVVDPQGNLIFRRVMAHSHVEEQPFQRTGGAIDIQPEQDVIVRIHLYPQGYGTQAMQGSVEQGFEKVTLPVGFAANLASVEPQPPECSF
ncbi:MAG: hypothetical protein AAFO04_05470 [Cyanobacteria bacterium J06592_8]